MVVTTGTPVVVVFRPNGGRVPRGRGTAGNRVVVVVVGRSNDGTEMKSCAGGGPAGFRSSGARRAPALRSPASGPVWGKSAGGVPSSASLINAFRVEAGIVPAYTVVTTLMLRSDGVLLSL